MLLLFSIRVAVWERALHSVYCTCRVWICMYASFLFGFEGGM